MKKTILKPSVIILFIVFLAIVIALSIYTRSWTIKDKYPDIDLSKCTKITGFYFKGNLTEDIAFTIDKNDKHFNEIINSFESTKFKTELSNVFSSNTKTSEYDSSDYLWHIVFHFENDKDKSFLHFENYFGNLEATSNGKQIKCSTSNQEKWSDEIMDIAINHPN